MDQLIYTAVGLVVGIVIGYLIGRKARTVYTQQQMEFDILTERRLDERRKHMDQILAIFNPGEEITTDKVKKLLLISKTNAEEYLAELGQKGKLVPTASGNEITYKLK